MLATTIRENLARALELCDRGQGRRRRLPRARTLRRAVPTLRRARSRAWTSRSTRSRTARPSRPAAGSSRIGACRGCSAERQRDSDVTCAVYVARVTDLLSVTDMQASAPPSAWPCPAPGDRRAQGDPHPPRGAGDPHVGRDRLHGRSLAGSEGRPHVAVPGAVRRGDRRGRARRGAARRGARRARIASQIVERQQALRAEVRIVARWPLRRTTPVTGSRPRRSSR